MLSKGKKPSKEEKGKISNIEIVKTSDGDSLKQGDIMFISRHD